MRNIVFITGNQYKADYVAKWLGRPIAHRKLDLDEIQSLDARQVAAHKARQAYDIAQTPVLVEDVSLTFTAMGRLPGPLVKWFLGEIGNEGLCRLADGLKHRKAVAEITYALCEGGQVRYFAAKSYGVVAGKPRGTSGHGWDPIFIPDGSTKTFGEMTDESARPFSARAQALDKLRLFLEKG